MASDAAAKEKKQKIIVIVLAAVFLVVLSVAVYIGVGGDYSWKDRTRQISVVSTAEAKKVAEKKTGGRATLVSMSKKDGKKAYKIKIVKGNKVKTVYVNAETGRMM